MGALKRQELKQSNSDRDNLCSLTMNACKPFLVVTQNKIRSLEMSITCLLLLSRDSLDLKLDKYTVITVFYVVP